MERPPPRPSSSNFLLNERAGDDWVLNRELGITVPLDHAIVRSEWGLPAAVPEGVLFHKAGGHLTAGEIAASGGSLRSHDEQDFRTLLPTLTEAARAWLRGLLATARPGHSWLDSLAP